METLHATTTDTRTHFIYRLFDADGVLLYVGMTVDLGGRFTDHRRKAWWKAVAEQRIEEAPTRADAFYLEAEAILTEHPKHNIDRPSWNRYDLLRSRATTVTGGVSDADRIASLEAQLRAQRRDNQQLRGRLGAAESEKQENRELIRTIAELDQAKSEISSLTAANAKLKSSKALLEQSVATLTKTKDIWRKLYDEKDQARVFVVHSPGYSEPAPVHAETQQPQAEASPVREQKRMGLLGRFLR